MNRFLILALLCAGKVAVSQNDTIPKLIVLGIMQDGGYPHSGCQRECCKNAWVVDSPGKKVVSLALISPKEKKWWLFEATPDVSRQLNMFSELTGSKYNYLPDGIFITHAHIGHYAGLMHFGREVMNTSSIAVYVLPKMKSFLEKNGPWSQLVSLKNIELKEIKPDSTVNLAGNITVSTFTVPHRDEFSETGGFKINTGFKKYLFIPDIDKWNKWTKNIVEEVKLVDLALLDATFYSPQELSHRKISEVPHPYVEETIQLFEKADLTTRNKIRFIHLNHTNPLLNDKSKIESVTKKGFFIAKEKEIL